MIINGVIISKNKNILDKEIIKASGLSNVKKASGLYNDYSNAYFQFIFNIKFETADACTKTNLTLKNSYEMIQELKIELNNKIISNEYNTNYSYIIYIRKF